MVSPSLFQLEAGAFPFGRTAHLLSSPTDVPDSFIFHAAPP